MDSSYPFTLLAIRMKLTETEKQTLRQGEPLRFEDEDVRCVVLRADLFDRYRKLFDETLPSEVTTTLVDETMTDADANDPLLASYQKYKS